ncbi:MAG: hypothetical protein Q7O66_18645 [Dehalococcoidia bacterium]|nr:hypothetical protein [Dehalococcoidia bacterium]
MLERLHEHIGMELQTNTRTDTIYVVVAVLFNFVMLGINSVVAGGASKDATAMIVLIISIVLAILVDGLVVTGLLTGRASRQKLLSGLIKMYEDAGVAKYYDQSLLTNYNRRYVIFSSIVVLLGLMAILIPLVILLT